MTTINLKDFYYWYTQDQFIEVTEEVAGALRASIRYEAAYSELAARINSAPLKKKASRSGWKMPSPQKKKSLLKSCDISKHFIKTGKTGKLPATTTAT